MHDKCRRKFTDKKKDLEASLHLMTLKKEVPQRNEGDYIRPDLTGDVIVFSVEKVPTTIRDIQIVALKFMK